MVYKCYLDPFLHRPAVYISADLGEDDVLVVVVEHGAGEHGAAERAAPRHQVAGAVDARAHARQRAQQHELVLSEHQVRRYGLVGHFDYLYQCTILKFVKGIIIIY